MYSQVHWGALAHTDTCAALGRCVALSVAFGRPKMSVWGHAGAGSPSNKVACFPTIRTTLKFAIENLEPT